MSTWAQPGRLRRPDRGLKTVEKSANSQFNKPPHTQNFGHPRATAQAAYRVHQPRGQGQQEDLGGAQQGALLSCRFK